MRLASVRLGPEMLLTLKMDFAPHPTVVHMKPTGEPPDESRSHVSTYSISRHSTGNSIHYVGPISAYMFKMIQVIFKTFLGLLQFSYYMVFLLVVFVRENRRTTFRSVASLFVP